MKAFVLGLTGAALLWGSVGFAAEVLGTALVDGRKVEILSDGTWQFSEPLPEDCQVVSAGLMLCADDGKWTKVAASTPDIAAQFRLNDSLYSMLIVETVGSDQGISQAFMRETVIDNAANAIGFDRDAVLVISVEDATAYGQDGETVSYFLEIDGLPVVYMNTVIIEADRTVQALTFEVAKDVTDFHDATHAEFLVELRTRD